MSNPLRIAVLAFSLASLSLSAQEKARIMPNQIQMTTYVVGFLRKGANWGTGTKEESERIQERHLANLRKMAEAGKLIVAGPFSDNGDLRGMLIFKVGSVEEARSLAEQDPAVQAGRLALELHPWFAAQGLKVDVAPK
jgi:uncharacterized protein YciI